MFLKKVSIRTRLTLLFVTIFGSTLIAFGILTFDFLAKSLQQEFDDALFNYAVDVSESVVLNPGGDLSFSSADMDQTKIYPFSLGTALIQIRHMTGGILSQVGNFGKLDLPYRAEFQELARGEEAAFRTLTKLQGLPEAEAPSYRIINFPLDNSPVPQLILQIAVPLTFVETQINNRKTLFQTGIPLVIIISTMAGFFLSSRALKPVQNMIQKARDISATDLSLRLPVPEANDEMQSLALTLNQMLGRIEKAFLSHERFVSDASHQLLTPLTIMKGELEHSLKAHPSGPEQKTFISNLQEVDHLISLVKNLLLLARVDAGFGAMNMRELYFDEIILDAIARAEKLARAKNIGLKFDIQNRSEKEAFHPKMKGDEDLLQNLIFSLIENAIKYSDSGTSIALSLEWTGHEQIFRIEDSGPGLPEGQIEALFGRFTRAETGRKVEGYGLGLAIAKKIAEIHHAELTAENRKAQTGALFQLRIKNI